MAGAEDLLNVRIQLLKRKLLELEDLAASFAPAMHSHDITDVTGLTAALADKEDRAAKGVADGYAALDATGKVPADQLPASGGSSVLKGSGSITVARRALSATGTIAAPGVLPGQIVIAALAPASDADENCPELLDLISLSATPGTDQITIDASFLTQTTGPVLFNWSAF